MMLAENGEDKIVREVTNEEFLEPKEEKEMLLNNMLLRKVN